MEPPVHSMNALFSQLGLPDSDDAIAAFVARHRPLPEALSLADADFWTPAQARLLRQAISDDADWAEVVDQLDARLRH